MCMNFSSVLALTPEDFPAERCNVCGRFLAEFHPEEVRITGKNKPICDDCYFKAIGKVVEFHPVGTPRRRVPDPSRSQ